jgi:uncharacterized protein (DUF2062 family)
MFAIHIAGIGGIPGNYHLCSPYRFYTILKAIIAWLIGGNFFISQVTGWIVTPEIIIAGFCSGAEITVADIEKLTMTAASFK